MDRSPPLIKRLLQPATEYRLTAWLFLRLLSLIYLVAFTSLAVQITGLAGDDGILPLGEHFDLATRHLGEHARLWFPSIFWWVGSGDAPLQGTALLGVMVSLVLLFGRWERFSLILLFVLYLSLYHAGQVFTNFQWDTLLLEAGFLAIFLPGGANRLLIFLFDWLLFRLRFMSGLFKLVSEDPAWSGFTALNHYFETQPLPHVGAWYAHQLPEWLLQTGVGVTFFSELIVPFFIFLPRRYRLAAAGITILMQLLIIATSNHNFINLLTILLCLFLLDDRIIGRILPRSLQQRLQASEKAPGKARTSLIIVSFLLILPASLIGFTTQVARYSAPDAIQPFSDWVRRFGIGHTFHIFPTMQIDRIELVIQGSNDGQVWQTYDFKYKPGDPSRAPTFNVPHQPRLDWMIWFTPTQQAVHMNWFGRFMQRLHQGSPSVTRLLATDPFPNAPPRYLRVSAYRYHFTSMEERLRSGNWWRAEYLGQFPRIKPRKP